MSFHVPEEYRIRAGRLASDHTYGNNGAFMIPAIIHGRLIFAIASDGADWDRCNLPGETWEHVSIHCEQGNRARTPVWIEMAAMKNLFWDREDTVVQFHPPESEYVNNHESTLHLWRPVRSSLPLPPSITVGFKTLGVLHTPEAT